MREHDALPGNPHYELADESIRASREGATEKHLRNAQIEATLAAAYEQRTQNYLVNMVAQAVMDLAEITLNETDATTINARLGLDEES